LFSAIGLYFAQLKAFNLFDGGPVWVLSGSSLPKKNENVSNELWIKNVETYLEKVVRLHAKNSDEIEKGIQGSKLIARKYVDIVREKAIKQHSLKGNTGSNDIDFFGYGGISSWNGNYGHDERKCWSWAIETYDALNKNEIRATGWHITPYYNSHKIGEFPDPVTLVYHSYVALSFDPNSNTHKATPDVVLDPWQRSRPDVFNGPMFKWIWWGGTQSIAAK
jgi:hypothetical protein